MGENVSLIDGHIDNEPKQTNYDRIKNMSIEELAEFLSINSVDDIIWIDRHNWIHIDKIKQYLESEVSE